MQKTNYTDYEMAAYLNNIDKKWHTKKVNGTTTEFYSGARLIAIGIYDNAKSTRNFYTI